MAVEIRNLESGTLLHSDRIKYSTYMTLSMALHPHKQEGGVSKLLKVFETH